MFGVKERGVGGPGAQLSKRTSTFVFSLRNKRLTGPQLVASLNGTRKTPVSTSTVKRRLRNAGLLGRVAKKKPYLRLANKNKIIRWAKEHRHWTEELCLEGQHPGVPSSLLTWCFAGTI
ncbi:unnamed protein product [Oncorhynchus mykiss]|uniref:Transposase Tc1-like domain-containing protein n=1 Tax=Oncorhynchus mykiss TaxID=8022 RepID=A0A060WMZ5_ONCMY|nr:unnamed protein product [Oncorhynchus mykiss]